MKGYQEQARTLIGNIIDKGTRCTHLNEAAQRVINEFLGDFDNSFIPTVNRFEELYKLYKKTFPKFDGIYNKYKKRASKKNPDKQATFHSKAYEWKTYVNGFLRDMDQTVRTIRNHLLHLLDGRRFRGLPYIDQHLCDTDTGALNAAITLWKQKKGELDSIRIVMGEKLEYESYFNEQIFKDFKNELKATLK